MRRFAAVFLSLTTPLLAAAAPSPPGEPRLFAEGIISTAADEFGGALSPDGQTLLFTISIPRSQMYVICESRLKGTEWQHPQVASFSGSYRDSDPVFSLDGTRVYFVSDRPVRGRDEKNFDIWYVERQRKGWSAPVHLPGPANSEGNEYFTSFSREGTLYFTSNRKGGLGEIDVYRSHLANGEYGPPENLGPNINGKGWVNIEAWVAPDESFLLVGAFGHPGGAGDSDIFVSYKEGAGFGPLKPLGAAVNTPVREYSPRLSPDGQTLFFTSERGLGTEPRARPWKYVELVARFSGTLNGLGNIYTIPLADALAGTRVGTDTPEGSTPLQVAKTLRQLPDSEIHPGLAVGGVFTTDSMMTGQRGTQLGPSTALEDGKPDDCDRVAEARMDEVRLPTLGAAGSYRSRGCVPERHPLPLVPCLSLAVHGCDLLFTKPFESDRAADVDLGPLRRGER